MKKEKALAKTEGWAIKPFKDEDLSIEMVQDILQTWLADLPITCAQKKVKCPNCPHPNSNTELCSREVNYCAVMYKGYIAQLGVEPTKLIDQKLVKDLVKIDLKLYRLEMADDGDYEQDQIVGVTETGEPLYTKQLANSVEYMEKLYNMKLKIMKQLGITMKGSNVHDNVNTVGDYSVVAAQVKANPHIKRELRDKKARDLGLD